MGNNTDSDTFIQQAIELHQQGKTTLSIEFQKLTWKIKDKTLLAQVRTAFHTGIDPRKEKAEDPSVTQEDQKSVADELQQAFRHNSWVNCNKRKKDPRDEQETPPQKKGSPASFANRPADSRGTSPEKLPSDWRDEGMPPRSFGGYMYSYCLYGLWGAENDKFLECRKLIQRNFPDCEKSFPIADTWLSKARNCLHEYEKGNRSDSMMKRIKALGDPLGYQIRRYDKKQHTQDLKREAQKKHKVVIRPIEQPSVSSGLNKSFPALHSPAVGSLNYKRHRNDITGLKPCDSWTLLIDESGNSEKGDFTTSGRAAGIIAGVLFPANQPLPKPLYPELHASEDHEESKIAAGDVLIENMLNASNCGVIALPIKSLRSSRDWGSAIGLLVDLVLRLLPLNGKTRLNVLVENKDAYDLSGSFAFLRDACYYRLMQSLPARSEKITLEMGVMTKNHTFNAYPDFAANTCLAWSNVAKTRLRITAWQKSCFLDYPPEDLAKVLEYYYTGKNLRTDDWNKLLAYDGMSGRNFISGILDSFGNELRKSVDDWEVFLRYTIDHLNSKAINLTVLERQISYLMQYQPLEGEIPPRLNLLWLTSKLATKNHHGELITADEENEFRRLIRQMYPEDAQLACWTTLHLAVAMTDSFDFARAKRIIRDFYDVRKYIAEGARNLYTKSESSFQTTPMTVPGINYFAQMLSSYGQHEAFTGSMLSAVTYFRKALELFGKLSDKNEKESQSSHTHAYLVLCLMDLPSMRKEFQNEFLRYFGKSALYAVKDFASNTERPYYHHILVRAMADHLLPEASEKAYLAEENSWKQDSWHPWELIQFYRGVMSKSLADKKKYMRQGYEFAMRDGGATLRMIGCGILGGLYFHDQSVKAELEKLTEQVIAELPALGKNRIEAMRRQIVSPLEPMTYIKKVIPFNFR